MLSQALSMAALARIYMATRAGEKPVRWHKLLFWLGIGLSISQSIIEAHGGHLDWRPRSDGPGLCVLFTLPLLP